MFAGQSTAPVTTKFAPDILNKGAADVIIPCCPPIVIEMKRQDHTMSSWEDGQQEYLAYAQTLGARVCAALGWRAAMRFVDECVGKEKPLD